MDSWISMKRWLPDCRRSAENRFFRRSKVVFSVQEYAAGAFLPGPDGFHEDFVRPENGDSVPGARNGGINNLSAEQGGNIFRQNQ